MVNSSVSAQSDNSTAASRAITFLVLVFPVMGTFFSPETYFSPQDFSITGAAIDRSWPIPVTRIVNVIVVFWLILVLINNIYRTLPSIVYSLSVIIFCFYIVLSSQWAYDPPASLNRGARALISVLFAIYIFSTNNHSRLINTIIIANITAILLSFLSVVIFPQYAYSLLNGYLDAWRGAFSHKNSLGAQMSLAIIFSFYGYITGISDKKLSLSTFILGFVLLILSKSATSLLCTIFSLVIMLIINIIVRQNNILDRFIIVICSLVATIIVFIVASYMDDILSLVGRSSTLTGRTEVWLVAETLIDRAPAWGLGNGFWAIDSPMRAHAWKLMGWAAPHAHSTYLDIWLQLGLIGLLMALYILAVCLLRMFRLILTAGDPQIVLWSGLLISITIRGTVETGFVEPGIGWFFPFELAFLGISHLLARRLMLIRKSREPVRNRHLKIFPPADQDELRKSRSS